jgi:LytS/YehU family sensor histidine kinase
VSWSRFVGIHLAATAVFWVLHVAGMWSLRMGVYHLAGWGAYDYGDMVFRAPMEGLKDFMSFAAFAAVFHIVDIRRRRQERDLASAQLESELREARLQALSAQLDPHFLFNALNTLSAVMFDDLAKADRLLGDLGQMLRDGLEAGGSTWNLDRELAYLAHYLAFVEARFGDRVRVELVIAEGIGSVPVPRFALQRLVENALKHNESQAGQFLHIRVEGRREGGSMRLAVQDDGTGFADADTSGLGLDNLRRSLELLYGSRSSLDAHNRDGGGAEVVLILPTEASHG